MSIETVAAQARLHQTSGGQLKTGRTSVSRSPGTVTPPRASDILAKAGTSTQGSAGSSPPPIIRSWDFTAGKGETCDDAAADCHKQKTAEGAMKV